MTPAIICEDNNQKHQIGTQNYELGALKDQLRLQNMKQYLTKGWG